MTVNKIIINAAKEQMESFDTKGQLWKISVKSQPEKPNACARGLKNRFNNICYLLTFDVRKHY